MIKVISTLMVLFLSFALADIGDKKITLTGHLKDPHQIKITPKILETIIKSSTFTLYNPWEKKSDKYTGILMDKFVEYFGASDVKNIKLMAIDDYRVDIPKNMWENERILIVTRVNDKFISIRQKGPLRIVFVDYDSSKKRYEKNLPLWLWMIKKVEFQ